MLTVRLVAGQDGKGTISEILLHSKEDIFGCKQQPVSFSTALSRGSVLPTIR